VLLEDEWVGFPLRKDYVDAFLLTKPEVEKLAKHVKEKMKDAIGPPVRSEQPPRIMHPPQ